MVLLVRITIVYVLAGAAVVLAFRDDPLLLLGQIFAKLPDAMGHFVSIAGWAAPVAALGLVVAGRREALGRVTQALVAIFVTMLFFLVFTLLKTTMAWIAPFWADPMLAELDRALHFGTDPWVFAHALAPWIDATLAARIYISWWAAPALFLPVLLILADGDAARVRRFIWLYAFAWIGLGNLVALGFLSAGPVFYDRLLGGESFAGLHAALMSSGVLDGPVGRIEAMLWTAYATGAQEAGSGISAFPSVHVAMSTVFALYLFERWRGFAPLSVTIVAVILFLSVYLGWHYAVDGYASIAFVVLAWRWLRRRDEQRAGARDVFALSPGLPAE